MTRIFTLHALAATALLAVAGSATAHITLPPGGAAAGSDYEAAFRVGHACKDAKATTGVTVRLPKGFTLNDAQARKGWKLDVQKAAGDGEVRWTADSPATALPGTERAEFILRGKLTATPGPLYFKVLQSCDNGANARAVRTSTCCGSRSSIRRDLTVTSRFRRRADSERKTALRASDSTKVILASG